jgi:hypothetical protein
LKPFITSTRSTLGLAWLVLGSLFFGSAHGTEVDSFTNRDAVFEDATPALNAQMNRRIEQAIKRTNKIGTCDAQLLYFEMGVSLRAGLLGAFMVSPLESYSNRSGKVDRNKTRRKDSIYKDLSVFESPPIKLYPLGALIKVNDQLIAGDKFSHFLNVGWTYYQIHYRKGQPVSEAHAYGEKTEEGIWGLATTGIYSYADLAANFSGMRFWASVLGEEDPLGRNSQPMVQCIEGHWERQELFSWADWVDPAWDEGINCNKYAPRVERNVPSDMACPADPSRCAEIVGMYGQYADRLISPECRAASAAP